MPRKLITILGRPDTREGRPRYSTTAYTFGDDWTSQPHAFFGLALYHWLARERSVDEVIVLGTPTSAWGTLHELHPDIDEEIAVIEELDALQEAVDGPGVTAAEVEAVAASLTQYLGGTAVRCLLIEDALGQTSGRSILARVAAQLSPDDDVWLDVTHGYRHLGLIAFEALGFTAQARDVRLRNVYYGAFTEGIARGVELEGAQHFNEWARALALFRTTGNLMPVVEALPDHRNDLAQPLSAMHFAITINAFDRAIKTYGQVHGALKRMREAEGLEGMVAEVLGEELRALFHGDHVADVQWAFAERALRVGDYMRAATLVFEAVLSAGIADRAMIMNRHIRDDARKELLDQAHTHNSEVLIERRERDYYKGISYVRNNVAHGSNPMLEPEKDRNRYVQEAMRDADSMRAYIEQGMDVLAPVIAKLKDAPLDLG